jgi:hypothetical protein
LFYLSIKFKLSLAFVPRFHASARARLVPAGAEAGGSNDKFRILTSVVSDPDPRQDVQAAGNAVGYDRVVAWAIHSARQWRGCAEPASSWALPSFDRVQRLPSE